ncbi:MAG: hypothetical protein H0U43_01635 [Chthoniobacterales bacterium]|nr:hypothetical protein [Chthoniobacterales bacterium]
MTTIDAATQSSPTAFQSPYITAPPPTKWEPPTGDERPDRAPQKRAAGSIQEVSRDYLTREVHLHFIAELILFSWIALLSASSLPTVLSALLQISR